MNPLLLLIRNPQGVATSALPFPQKLVHLCAGAYLLFGAFAFQFLYPRLLDKMPMLGALRKINILKEKTFFSPKLFGYGLLICAVSLIGILAVYAIAEAIKNRKVDFNRSYRSSVVTIVPFLIGLIVGSFLLYPVHHYLGLLPMYGIMVSCCLQGAILRESYSLNLAVSCWLIPVLIGLQFYLLNLVRP